MLIDHPNGGSVYAYTGGRAWETSAADARPCVVMLHGALNDHSVWTLPARWLAHHGRDVLVPDLPGHGRSGGPVLPDVGALADWLLALLDRLGRRRVALIGHSMGSLIALEAASRAVGSALDVSHLVLVGTAVPMPVSAALLATAAQQPLQAIEMVVSFAHSSLGAKPGNPGPGTWHHGASRQLMRQVLARSMAAGESAGVEHNLFHHDFGICNAYQDGMAAAARVAAAGATRCSVVVGERDRMTAPRAAQDVTAALAAQRLGLPKAGHDLMQEDPEGLLQALRRALI
ncbi:alpha/beta hydrolase fold [Leptothrix cholodnii SP-6]|uniref:Alpha/beta hydrolase fold n=1 Tax=Leptothrix cholodnii (strain ATCC 51168 / LMG 8142 / SP-6) TaxID=395495 RepID=B1XWC1_LEPCP|nr:alpha/beta hydrolase [Leptothrix cholodnii]ACB33789.1 alpha/beta hydrolase fold [Leptothrix cholodnii SP-6]